MRVAFYVDSSYQLLNCINFVWNNTEQSKGNTDLYLGNGETVFKSYHNLIPMLQSSNLFSNIFLIRAENFQKSKIIGLIRIRYNIFRKKKKDKNIDMSPHFR